MRTSMLSCTCRHETEILLVAARDGAFYILSTWKQTAHPTYSGNLGILPTGRFMFGICLIKRGVTSKQPESGVFHSAHSVNHKAAGWLKQRDSNADT